MRTFYPVTTPKGSYPIRVDRLNDSGTWQTTANATDVGAAARHADAVGGCVRALRGGSVIAAWRDGVELPESEWPREDAAE